MSSSRALLMTTSAIQPNEMAELSGHFEIIHLSQGEDVLSQRGDDIVAIASSTNSKISRDLIEMLPKLEIISQFAVGTDNIDLTAAKERGIRVTNTPDVLTDDTADTAFALLIAVSRRICEGDRFVRNGQWSFAHTLPLGRALSGKICGIVGMGRIGQAIAKRCEAFGMTIRYHGPREKPDLSYAYEPNLQKMAQDCDYLVLACPGGAATKHIVNEPILTALGPQSYLINVSRGSVVKEDDLVSALKEKKIAGAGLDVYADEPNVPSDLLTMDNVVLLPHIGSATIETRAVMGQLVVKNLLAHFNGDPLLTPVI